MLRRKHGSTDSRNDGSAERENTNLRIYESTEKRLRKGKSEGSLEQRPNVLKVGKRIKIDCFYFILLRSEKSAMFPTKN